MKNPRLQESPMGEVMRFGYYGWFRFSELQISGDVCFHSPTFLDSKKDSRSTSHHSFHHTSPPLVNQWENESRCWNQSPLPHPSESLISHADHIHSKHNSQPRSVAGQMHFLWPDSARHEQPGVSASLPLPDSPSSLVHFALIKASLCSTRWHMPVPYQEPIRCQNLLVFK